MHHLLRVNCVRHNVHNHSAKTVILVNGCLFGVHDRVLGNRKDVFAVWNIDKFSLPIHGEKYEVNSKTINRVDIQIIQR